MHGVPLMGRSGQGSAKLMIERSCAIFLERENLEVMHRARRKECRCCSLPNAVTFGQRDRRGRRAFVMAAIDAVSVKPP